MDLQDILRLAQSGARGFTTGLLGAPVDIANMAMGGVGGQKPVMGSEWIGDKLQNMGLLAPQATDLPNEITEFAGGLLNPGGGAAVGKGLLGGAKLAHIVFHGSPHTFDKFDMAKIGTGEGAQAYGHGLYFAENPKVADSYKPKSGLPEWNGKRVSSYGMNGTVEYADGTKGKVSDSQWGAFRDAMENGPRAGNLYKVDIPDEAIGRMLDWDKPLSQQPQAVRDALERGMPELYRLSSKWDSTAAGFVDALEKSDGRAGAAARLRSLGIPGIRYLDQGSRDAGKGTSNYVLFDDALAKIVGRE